MRPQASVVGLAPEAVDAPDVRLPRGREVARRHDQVWRGDNLAVVGPHGPAVRQLIKDGRYNDRVELDVLANIKSIGHVPHVREDLILVAITFGPLPFLVELGRERERVFEALYVATASRVAVPVPGAANIGTLFEGARPEADLAQLVNRIDATHARANNDGVEVIGAGLGHQRLLEHGNRWSA